MVLALGAVPASDARPARGLARVGAVAGERTAPVRVVRTPRKACIAPRPGSNVLLAGVPRRVSKLHRPWPGGGLPRGPTPLSGPGAKRTTAPPRRQALRGWTRPADRASSYGPCGHGVGKCPALAHPVPTLAALAPTTSPLLQQRFIRKGASTTPHHSRTPPSSQEIRHRNKPVKSQGIPREKAKNNMRQVVKHQGLVEARSCWRSCPISASTWGTTGRRLRATRLAGCVARRAPRRTAMPIEGGMGHTGWARTAARRGRR